MNKATFERALKRTAAGMPLKKIEFLDEEGTTYEILNVEYDQENDIIFIKGRVSE